MALSGACLVKFDHQVAGHDKIMRFSTDDVLIVKPCKRTELTFYETALQYPEFLEWIPECYGTLRAATDTEARMLQDAASEDAMAPGVRALPINATSVDNDTEGRPQDENLCLENLTHGFVRPCILDLKLGFRLYDPEADTSKREKMITNAKGTTTESLGLRISGMKVHDALTMQDSFYPKRFGRTRTDHTILDALLAYFFPTSTYGHISDPHILRMDNASSEDTPRGRISSKKVAWIIESFMDDLRAIRHFIAENVTLQLIGTSLLFVYEGDRSTADSVWAQMLQEDQTFAAKCKNDTNGETSGEDGDDSSEEEHTPRLCDLRLIDFAHSRWDAQQTDPDNDLLRAIDNVLELLSQCLNRQQSEKL